jgi:opacity protein-like surface antigen
MRNTLFASTLAFALAVSGAAVAQSTTSATNPPSPDTTKPQTSGQKSALSIDKITQDLQKAGFSDVKVLEDAFLVQAKTKDGNPIIMTIGQNGVSGMEMSKSTQTTGQVHSDNSPATSAQKPTKN